MPGPAAPSQPSGPPIDRGRAAAAIVAGWLVPGAGHAVLGRVRRGIVFFVLIMGSFGLGLAHDGKLALYTGQERLLSTLQVIGNAGVGPVDALARLHVYGGAVYERPETTDPSYQRVVDIWRERQRSALSIYGTAYLWTAGLMNLLLLLDVWDISVGRKD
jgi:Family of unknown function (DUF6677)